METDTQYKNRMLKERLDWLVKPHNSDGFESIFNEDDGKVYFAGAVDLNNLASAISIINQYNIYANLLGIVE